MLLADQHTIKCDPRFDFSTSRRTKAIITFLIDWRIEKINQEMVFSLFTPAQEAQERANVMIYEFSQFVWSGNRRRN